MKDRTISFLLTILMAFSLLPAAGIAEADPSKAAGNCKISVSQVSAKPGETVTVELSIENNPGIQGATLTVSWDDGLTLTKKAQNGTAFSALGLTAPKKLESPYNLVWYAQDLEAEDIKDGVIAALEFEISEQAQGGQNLAVNVSYIFGDIVDCNKQYLPPTTENGFVAVEGAGHTHNYNKTIAAEKYLARAATCTEAAVYYCSCECGETGTQTFSYGDPLGHNFVNGECTRCHKTEAENEERCVIRASQISAKPGETVTVELSVEDNPGIQGATLTVTWDEGLTLKKKAQNGGAFSALGLTAPKKLDSPYNLVWYAQDLEAEDIKDGVIATLEFEVSAQAKDKDVLNIGVSYIYGDVVDCERKAVTCRIFDGKITVSDIPVQAQAVQTGDTVTVSITSEIEASSVVIYLAEYAEDGRFIGCIPKTINLQTGENAVTFANTGTETEHKAFITGSGQVPLCAAAPVEK